MFQTHDRDRRAVGYWLLFMAFIIFVMVVVGGATRLTESGLSMVNWNPVTGALPPMSEAEWMDEFNDYKASPEYKLKNAGMSLEDFKGIFYWEWGHRLLGRLIGVFFFVPFAWFWAKGRIPSGYKPRLVVLFVLGGLQGLLGWYMVKSGLVDEPAVSHYRLTAHLSLALFLFAAILWTGLSLLNPRPSRTESGVKRLTHIAMLVLVLQLVMGALVAGLKAGHIFNTWPLMGETFVPDGLLGLEPAWRNFFDNAVTVQFDHRIGAYVLTGLMFVILIAVRKSVYQIKAAAYLFGLSVLLQMALGIIMLLNYVPVSWGTAHQGGGVLVLAALINLMHIQRRGEAK
nr:COX15/CtaA family protein [Kordiimonas sp. SCSIO 12603]